MTTADSPEREHDGPEGEDPAYAHVVAVADDLFYTHGIRAVTMRYVRDEAGIPLKRLYRMFPSKEVLVAASLRRRDETARTAIQERVDAAENPTEKVLAVFDFLNDWFHQPGFRGCVFVDAFGQLGGTSPEVHDVVVRHKRSLRDLVIRAVEEMGVPNAPVVGAQLAVLVDGAMAHATIAGDPDAARYAQRAARTVLNSGE
ncbi:TetR/AcrR family transcriptional regulator [Streptomyces sp. AJS327]|uniref:TetR/AcrR family transcriptional regulator n=1 Tax=Streptomyces sp. AJS327 TaxID=2545265 RepID=UPI0015E0544E|nr:TetR/AcrR family transcriptional regulator [Streptomyces sp. AJS327]MBA0050958.1 TetR/AcrR family transcriptional regulator [Streptomyces sp. AJS327]